MKESKLIEMQNNIKDLQMFCVMLSEKIDKLQEKK
jgi:hypothetical protein